MELRVGVSVWDEDVSAPQLPLPNFWNLEKCCCRRFSTCEIQKKKRGLITRLTSLKGAAAEQSVCFVQLSGDIWSLWSVQSCEETFLSC